MTLFQLAELDSRSAAVEAAVEALATQGSIEERGAIFTRAEVVAGLLDLCGYTERHDLTALRLLEPSCGDGEFLLAAVARLLASCAHLHGPPSAHAARLAACVRAVELHRPTLERTRERLRDLLRAASLTPEQATALVSVWTRQDDFLLTPIEGEFDVVVGNPPYVRQERIPSALLSEYRDRFKTLYDRADLYVLFYERCLDLLRPQGVLGFICANRWVKNKYGGPLREKISRDYNLDVYIDLAQVSAFHEEVDAYPAITVLRRAAPSVTRVLTPPDRAAPLAGLFEALLAPTPRPPAVQSVRGVGAGSDPWLVDAPEMIETLRALESAFPTLEAAGARVGIGVATGADRVFIGEHCALPVEEERRLPLVMSGDLRDSRIEWSGQGVINPYLPDGTLAPLADYPRFAAYMHEHAEALKRRHTAQKSPRGWYKTLDRIHPHLTSTPKLLIPDIKGEATVVLDEGRYYPHHNLYVVTSDTWDLRALQALLRSSVALSFVAAYCVKMSGGFLRFQAQYLRRVRVPSWSSLTPRVRSALVALSDVTDQGALDAVVAEAYGLSAREAGRIEGFASSARVNRIQSA